MNEPQFAVLVFSKINPALYFNLEFSIPEHTEHYSGKLTPSLIIDIYKKFWNAAPDLEPAETEKLNILSETLPPNQLFNFLKKCNFNLQCDSKSLFQANYNFNENWSYYLDHDAIAKAISSATKDAEAYSRGAAIGSFFTSNPSLASDPASQIGFFLFQDKQSAYQLAHTCKSSKEKAEKALQFVL